MGAASGGRLCATAMRIVAPVEKGDPGPTNLASNKPWGGRPFDNRIATLLAGCPARGRPPH